MPCANLSLAQGVGLDFQLRAYEPLMAAGSGEAGIRERGLPELVKEGLASGRLTFTTSYDHAKEQWATSNSKNTGDTVQNSDISPYMKGSTMPGCPSGGTYTLGAIGTLPSCTKSASPDLHVLPN